LQIPAQAKIRRRRAQGAWMLLMSFGVATAARSQEAPPIPSGAEPYRVRVELALVQAAVRNPKGAFVRGLQQKDFQVLENGKPQEIVVFSEGLEGPVRVAILLDVSGSMRLRGRLEDCRTAIRDLLNRLAPDDEAALFAFADGKVDVLVNFTTDRAAVREALISREGYGQTALIDAVAEAPNLVPRKGNQKAAIVLLTDGVDTASRLHPDQAIEIARRTQVPLYTVFLVDPHEERRQAEGAAVVTRLAEATGGATFFANLAVEVQTAIRRIVEDLKLAYVVGYYPSSAPGPHELEVRASCRKCVVSARQGVYAVAAADGGTP
jgi:VWFA-related protein